MKPTDLEPDDLRLGALLRESRAAPPLPPRFPEGVWRRIEDAEAPGAAAAGATWMDLVVAWVLRPRLAFAFATVLMLAGALAGMYAGNQLARKDAAARYVTTVAPDPLR
jgi:hypothetical protein